MAGNSGNPIDLDLIPGNVKNLVDIFGVDGNYTGPAGGAIGVGSKVILHADLRQAASSTDMAWDYYIHEATNHIFIVGIYCADGSPIEGAHVGIMVMNKNTGEIKISMEVYDAAGGQDRDNANAISYDDTTGDFYYTYETSFSDFRKFTYATGAWSGVGALSGTTATMTSGGFVLEGNTGTGGNIVYGGKTYTLYVDNVDADSTTDLVGIQYLLVT